MATLNIRNIDPQAAERIKRAAHARQLTVGEYLARLIDLHDAIRAEADSGDAALRIKLEALELATVST